MKFACIESTIDLPIDDNRIIRLWINQAEVEDDYPVKEIIEELDEFLAESRGNKEIINFISENLFGVNAVQIKTDGVGVQVGVVAYLVDFNDSIHG